MSDTTPESLTIAVCVKYTLDVEQIKPDPSTGEPALARVGHIVNTFDLNGIEAALRLRDDLGGRVVGISLTPERPPENVLFQSMAMGLDELYLVTDEAVGTCDALGTASALAAAVRKLGAVDLVVCSDTSVDEYRGEVGPRLAEELGLPCVSYVTQLAVQDGTLRADRALESVVETIETTLPAVVSVGSEANDPRMPTMRHIRQARERPIIEWPLTEVPGGAAACAATGERIATLAVHAPPSERKHVMIEGKTSEESAHAVLEHLLNDGVVKL